MPLHFVKMVKRDFVAFIQRLEAATAGYNLAAAFDLQDEQIQRLVPDFVKQSLISHASPPNKISACH
ncbi:hypothetical protein CIC12_18330 [Burkholderia sp. SG-MS1]|nr:hypothetical protein [Paraburkholderia sp. SG-MS1]